MTSSRPPAGSRRSGGTQESLRLEVARLREEVARLENELAQLTEALRRSASDVVAFGGLTLRRSDRSAELDGRELHLLPREHGVCMALALAGGGVVPTAELQRRAGRGDPSRPTNVVAVHVSRLRARLAGGSVASATERGRGYRLEPAEKASGARQ